MTGPWNDIEESNPDYDAFERINLDTGCSFANDESILALDNDELPY